MSVLLDTCALMFLAMGRKVRTAARAAIEEAATDGHVFVSVASAWEVGLLSSPDRRQPVRFDPDPAAWFRRASSQPGMSLTQITSDIAVRSAHLDPASHRDPADRLLIATALVLEMPLVTRDALILDYAKRSALQVIAC